QPAHHGKRGQRRDQREHARRGPGALVPPEPGRQRDEEHHDRRGLPAHGTSSRSSSAAPWSGVSAPPAPPSTRATSVLTCHPPVRTSPTGPSAITSPWPSSTARSASWAANSVSCVAT